MRLTKWLTGKAEAGSSEIPPVRLKPTHKNQHDEDNQDDADDTDASVTVAVAVTAEPAAEAAQQEDDEDNDKDESHDFFSFGMTRLNIGPLRNLEALYRRFRNDAPSTRHPGNPELLLFDGNTAFADVDVDTGGLLPLLVELIAEDRDGDDERADDEVKNAAIHRAGDLFCFARDSRFCVASWPVIGPIDARFVGKSGEQAP